MLLNCTNHPYDIWSEPMKEAANKQYGEVVDLPFPQVDPAWRDAQIRKEVDRYTSRIKAFEADAVLAAGEFTFLFMLVDKLLAEGTEVMIRRSILPFLRAGIGMPCADLQIIRRNYMLGSTLDMAPAKGYLLAYFKNALVFEPYTVQNDQMVFPGCENWHNASPKECHLFDQNKEYRMIFREARQDRVEAVLTRQQEEIMDPDLLYEEEVLLKNDKAAGIDSLKIINRYKFTENDTLVLRNYRIALK